MNLHINRFIILFIFLISSCDNQERDVLEEYIKKIDKIPISETSYIFEVDSEKRIMDTLALRKFKYDENKTLIFENNFQLKYNLEMINYYDTKNGIVYSETKVKDEIISDFRVNLRKGLIVSANYNVYEDGIIDSVFMKYDYTFDKDKKKRLLIDSGDDFKTIELYDELEKLTLEVSMLKKDTLEKTEFTYDKEGFMRRKRVDNFSRNEEIIYDYDEGVLVRESFFKNGIGEFITDYYKDKQGNYLSYTKIVKDTI
ncbi:MAG: hypothetical protein WBA61_13445 [Aequorivita sp.]